MTSTTFRISGERPVHRLGFGAMRLPAKPAADRASAIAVARRTVELGVTLIDTAHLYGWGANEELLAEALHPYPDDLLIATKVGFQRTDTAEGWAHNARPDSLRRQVDDGLRRLKADRIELLQLHRIDPAVPLPEQLGALKELQTEGKIDHIGLSEVTVSELSEARLIIDVASVQNRYNLFDREHDAVLDVCTEAGIAFLPWRPVAGEASAAAQAVVREIADELGATTAQISLAWLLARSPVVLPIPGTASVTHLAENCAAADLQLTETHMQRLNKLPA